MRNGTMVAQNRGVRDLGVFLNPEVVDVTITKEEELERFRKRAEGGPTIRGLGIIPFIGRPRDPALMIGVGVVSAALSGLGAFASFRALAREKSPFWSIVHVLVGSTLALNTLGSAAVIISGLAGLAAPDQRRVEETV